MGNRIVRLSKSGGRLRWGRREKLPLTLGVRQG